MAYMTLNGVTVLVAARQCREAEMEYGDRTPGFTGAGRQGIRSRKRVWDCTAKGLSYSAYETLLAIIEGGYADLNGDVVGNPVVDVVVLGKVNSAEYSPRAMSGTWTKNVREMSFTLTEA